MAPWKRCETLGPMTFLPGQLAARDVRATVTGAGRITVDAKRSLDASIPGVGEIVYSGHPMRVMTNVAGSGTIHRG
jgi:Putative auto-transporter adhesin, head GIN domain